MKEVLLDDIDFRINFKKLLKKLKTELQSENANRIKELANEAMEVAKPKALYKITYINEHKEDSVIIDGIEFNSRILSVNFESVQRVFPFIATSGEEIEEWSGQYNDMLESYWIDVIKDMALDAARDALKKHISEFNNPGSISKMNPGSLPEWPISEQEKLFELLEDPTEKIGVKLTSSFLMQPVKTTSGIWFPTETSFKNCQLCSREDCSNREAAYNKNLYKERYKKE
ncbi:vitamin B12 dependent-methionine synthase activation domain-containing protein [Selenihalanaerobacter shriftii]|uniref:Vitamin B12 dependent methionine synthase, activation domain n=1 Tax=Selenihalanaerobacter shriftii TaxID=142842 RepID=A0A1T4LYZ3_9FIRM|nr:vitamin B12 dependent-methionine synthase activation domain-containing protein [Selenihalanaerobacter shriftii]SJZ59877.1 Vitamin B12 dependent methionine synthase, activation domain [Selenihalanaerobacter shriftii]